MSARWHQRADSMLRQALCFSIEVICCCALHRMRLSCLVMTDLVVQVEQSSELTRRSSIIALRNDWERTLCWLGGAEYGVSGTGLKLCQSTKAPATSAPPLPLHSTLFSTRLFLLHRHFISQLRSRVPSRPAIVIRTAAQYDQQRRGVAPRASWRPRCPRLHHDKHWSSAA